MINSEDDATEVKYISTTSTTTASQTSTNMEMVKPPKIPIVTIKWASGRSEATVTVSWIFKTIFTHLL